jgi:hypothetical protein
MTEKRFALRAAAGFAGIVMAASLAAAPAIADSEKDKGGNGRSEQAHENAPGQQKKEEAGNPQPSSGNGNPPAHAGGPSSSQTPAPAPAKPAKPAKPARPAKPAKPAKPQHSAAPAKPAHPAHPAHPVHPVKPAKPAHPVHAVQAPAKPANPHAKAGKTTICHSTGSATNPFVTITLSDNALPAHTRHHDGRDLIPAPAGGCPQPAAGKGAVDSRPAAEAKDAPAAAPAAPAAGDVLGFVGTSADESPAGAVLGEVAEGGAAPAALPKLRETIADKASVARRETGTQAAATGQLPFTGLEAALVALFGALLLLTGILFRQLSGPRTAQ